MTDPKDGVNRGGNPAARLLAKKIGKIFQADNSDYHLFKNELESLLAEAMAPILREGWMQGHKDGLLEAYDRAAEVAEKKYSSRVLQEAVGNLIAERIWALKGGL